MLLHVYVYRPECSFSLNKVVKVEFEKSEFTVTEGGVPVQVCAIVDATIRDVHISITSTDITTTGELMLSALRWLSCIHASHVNAFIPCIRK